MFILVDLVALLKAASQATGRVRLWLIAIG
jgi:hypothetical protein